MRNPEIDLATVALLIGMVIAGGAAMLVLLLVNLFVEVSLLTAFLVIALVSIVAGFGGALHVRRKLER